MIHIPYTCQDWAKLSSFGARLEYQGHLGWRPSLLNAKEDLVIPKSNQRDYRICLTGPAAELLKENEAGSIKQQALEKEIAMQKQAVAISVGMYKAANERCVEVEARRVLAVRQRDVALLRVGELEEEIDPSNLNLNSRRAALIAELNIVEGQIAFWTTKKNRAEAKLRLLDNPTAFEAVCIDARLSDGELVEGEIYSIEKVEEDFWWARISMRRGSPINGCLSYFYPRRFRKLNHTDD